MHHEQRGPPFFWWIDAVGGYLALPGDRVQIGSAGNPRNGVAVYGDLSRHHADLVQEAPGAVLVAHADTTVNGKSGTSFLLQDGDRVRMRSVELLYRRPAPWSRTARLTLASPHRFAHPADGVLLLSETCILGRGRDAHIPAPWAAPVCVTWHRGQYWLRAPGEVEIDGQTCPGWGPLGNSAKVRAAWGKFRWEPANIPEGAGGSAMS
jgi:hypothetical protein